jgi:predicted nuclease of predicted toxin-antitoxin system
VKILVDMNLSPEWLPILEQGGWEACHWSSLGPPGAPDTDLMKWATQNGCVLLTQDLDFAQLLFHAQAGAPSVILLRIRDELISTQQARICSFLKVAAPALEAGALLVIDEYRARLRRLPIVTDDKD